MTINESARSAVAPCQVNRPVFDKRPGRNKVVDMVSHVLLHRARSRQVLRNVGPELVPRATDLLLEIAAKRCKILVQSGPMARHRRPTADADLWWDCVRMAPEHHLLVDPARSASVLDP